jgi:hypothetical protein
MPPSRATRPLSGRSPPVGEEVAYETPTDPNAPAGDILPALAALLIALAEQDAASAGNDPQQDDSPLAATSRKCRKGALSKSTEL